VAEARSRRLRSLGTSTTRSKRMLKDKCEHGHSSLPRQSEHPFTHVTYFDLHLRRACLLDRVSRIDEEQSPKSSDENGEFRMGWYSIIRNSSDVRLWKLPKS
jgi:hypothetical protein